LGLCGLATTPHLAAAGYAPDFCRASLRPSQSAYRSRDFLSTFLPQSLPAPQGPRPCILKTLCPLCGFFIHHLILFGSRLRQLMVFKLFFFFFPLIPFRLHGPLLSNPLAPWLSLSVRRLLFVFCFSRRSLVAVNPPRGSRRFAAFEVFFFKLLISS